VDEDRTLFVVRARIRTRRGGPATQRSIRNKGNPLAERDRAQAAAQRGAHVVAGRDIRGAGTARVIGNPQFLEDDCIDGEHGVLGHVPMLDRRTCVCWQETDVTLMHAHA
jgi:hypothetical protein